MQRRLEPLIKERLGRLKAEYDAARVHAEMKKLIFEREVQRLASSLEIKGEFELDLEQGIINTNEQGEDVGNGER